MRSVIIFLLLSCPAWANWTNVGVGKSLSCAGSVSACNVTVTNPLAGDLLVGIVMGPGTSITLSSITCGSDTLTNASSVGAELSFTAAAYKLSATGGTGTTCTAHISANPGGTWKVYITEWHATAGAVFDTQASRDQSTNSTSPVAPAITLTSGANDLILETENNLSSTTDPVGGCSGGQGYTSLDSTGIRVLSNCKNSNDSTSPTWTTNSGKCLLYAIAFKETIAGGGASLVPHRGIVF